MSGDIVRLRQTPTTKEPTTCKDSRDLDAYFLTRRAVLADELRAVETICLQRGLISRKLCAPGRVR